MPKQKTKKSVLKRVKVTGTGKVLRYAPGSGHLKSRKSPKQLRNYRKATGLSKAFTVIAKELLASRA